MTDFEKVTDFDNLYRAYRKAKSGKGYKNSSARFEVQALSGIHKLKNQLETKQGIKFLGFHTYIVDGKVMCKIRNENKRNAHKRYKKMAKIVVDGKLDRKKFDECYQSWKAHAKFGNCKGIIDNLDRQISQILGD